MRQTTHKSLNHPGCCALLILSSSFNCVTMMAQGWTLLVQRITTNPREVAASHERYNMNVGHRNCFPHRNVIRQPLRDAQLANLH